MRVPVGRIPGFLVREGLVRGMHVDTLASLALSGPQMTPRFCLISAHIEKMLCLKGLTNGEAL